MRGARHRKVAGAAASSVRQLVIGLLALPLSALPLVGYLNLTPEGRLVRDRAMVALFRPTLPKLTAAQQRAAAEAAPRYQGAVMALAYHGIGSASDAEGGFVISPGRFGEHLATLKAAGMSTVTADQVARSLEGGPALPDNAVMISFDDGRSDAMMFADPLLEDAGMSATMFVITGAAAKPGIYYASWDALESYAGSGRWDLQAHTAALHMEHEAAGGRKLPALTSLGPGESLAEYRLRVRVDLATASDAIERHVGRRPAAFAYPFGAYGADRTNSPAIRGILAEEVDRRYAVAFHQDEQESIPLVTEEDDRLGLRRLEVQDWSGVDLLARIDLATRLAADPEPHGPDGPAADPAGDGQEVPAPDTAGPASPTPPVPGSTVVTVAPGAGTVRPPTRSSPPTSPSSTAPRTTTPPPPTAPVPPPTAPPPTSPTTQPSTTTTTAPPPTTVPPTTTTTTTTAPNGCRSHGQGNVCGPGRGG